MSLCYYCSARFARSKSAMTISSGVEKTNIEKIASGGFGHKYEDADAGACVVIDVNTGEILAMASYPNYNLNTPFTPNESLAKVYDSLSDEDKGLEIQKMWRNNL